MEINWRSRFDPIRKRKTIILEKFFNRTSAPECFRVGRVFPMVGKSVFRGIYRPLNYGRLIRAEIIRVTINTVHLH